jgi:hypothetical protein
MHVPSMMTLDHLTNPAAIKLQIAAAIAVVIGFLIGFGVRASISHRRRAKTPLLLKPDRMGGPHVP